MAMLRSEGDHAEMTLVCRICGMRFLQYEMSAAEAHVRNAHPETLKTTISCRICGQGFSDSEAQTVIEHMRTRHPQEFDDLLRRLGDLQE